MYQMAEELIPIEYKKTQEMNTLEQDALIRLEVERILELIRNSNEIDYEIIVDIFIHEMTEADVSKNLEHFHRLSINGKNESWTYQKTGKRVNTRSAVCSLHSLYWRKDMKKENETRASRIWKSYTKFL